MTFPKSVIYPALDPISKHDHDTYEIVVVFRRSIGDDNDFAEKRVLTGKSPNLTEALVTQFCEELQDCYNNEELSPAGSFDVVSINMHNVPRKP